MAEAHSFRQLFNADVARGFAEYTLNPLYPQVSWGGPGGVVGMEFPLLQFVLGLAFRLVGEHEVLARLIVIPTSLGLVIATYRLGTSWFDTSVGRGAAFLLAVSPSVAFFGRTFLADEAMVMCGVLALVAYTQYFETDNSGLAWRGSGWLALGALLKLPALLVVAPLAWLAIRHRGWRDIWADRVLLTSALLALVVTVAWYGHAHHIYRTTGLTVAIFAPAGQYPPPLADVLLHVSTVTSWASASLLLDLGFYRQQILRAIWLHVTPLGMVGVVFGVIASRRSSNRSLLDIWLAAGLAFIVAAARGHHPHQYYQLPLLPIAALYFGLGASPLFSSNWLQSRSIGPRGRAFVFTALSAIAIGGFLESHVIQDLFRPRGLDWRVVTFGRLLDEATPPGALVLTVEHNQAGNQSPLLLYRAHRRGWSLDLESVSPKAVEMLRASFHVDFVAVSVWEHLEVRRPDMVDALQRYRRVPLNTDDPQVRLFDLRSTVQGAH